MRWSELRRIVDEFARGSDGLQALEFEFVRPAASNAKLEEKKKICQSIYAEEEEEEFANVYDTKSDSYSSC